MAPLGNGLGNVVRILAVLERYECLVLVEGEEVSEKIREEFEAAYFAHIQNKLGGPVPKSILNEYLECGSDGEYRSFQAAGAWWGWQASRESLVIELPEDFTSVGSPNMRMLVAHHREVVGLLVQSIEAAGVKVKS